LDPVPESGSGIDVRRVLGKRLDPAVRDAFAAAVRSAQPAALTLQGVTLRACPLFIRSHTPALAVGLLVVAVQETAAAGRRIDGLIEWLAPAMEASLLASFEATDELQVARAFVGVFELVGTLAKLDDDERILTLTMEAIALWYDADVRVYRQAVSGA